MSKAQAQRHLGRFPVDKAHPGPLINQNQKMVSLLWHNIKMNDLATVITWANSYKYPGALLLLET